jgi:hypothetical protein
MNYFNSIDNFSIFKIRNINQISLDRNKIKHKIKIKFPKILIDPLHLSLIILLLINTPFLSLLVKVNLECHLLGIQLKFNFIFCIKSNILIFLLFSSEVWPIFSRISSYFKFFNQILNAILTARDFKYHKCPHVNFAEGLYF